MTTKSKSGITDWNLWRTELDRFMLGWSISLPDDITPNEACTSFTSTILDWTEKVIPKKVISKHSKPFFNAQLTALQTNIKKSM